MNIKDPIKLQSLKKALHWAILLVCICVLVFSLFMIAKKLYGYYNDNKKYEEIRTQVTSNDLSERFRKASDPSSAAGTFLEKPEVTLPYISENGNLAELDSDGILSGYSKLKKQNSDLVGWIQVPGFKNPIDYPVMQTKDNDYYLKKDFYKNSSYAGSIFMDFRNSSLKLDRHTILYGHAMNDHSMFGNLKEFPGRPEDYTKITKVYMDLMNTRLEFEIFSTYYENASYNYRQTSFTNDAEYLSFLERIRSKSVYDYKVKLTALDKIITLSTCNDNLGGEVRSITHARLVRQIVYDKASGAPPEAVASGSAEKNIVSANTYLSELLMSYGAKEKPEEAIFTPAFNTAFRTFSTQLAPEAETVLLSYKAEDPEAAVTVTLNEKKADPLSLKLEYGENVIKIKVVSRDTLYSRTYTINATRLPLPEPAIEPAAGQ